MFDELSDLYQQVILDHCKNPRNFRELPQCSCSAQGHNPLCGDRVTMDVRLDDGRRIVEVAHQVRGCLLCQASASALASIAQGRDLADVEALRGGLNRVIGRETPNGGEKAEVFDAFAPLKDHRARHDCVNLPFDALEAALKGE